MSLADGKNITSTSMERKEETHLGRIKINNKEVLESVM